MAGARTTARGVSAREARAVWIRAQKLDVAEPFGAGPAATAAAIAHLGYVQIDTINVVERCHHHILWNRIPAYRREDLRLAQSVDKSVFEYWTHALAYVPSPDLRFYLGDMRAYRREPGKWFRSVTRAELRKAIERVEREGPLSIRDIDDDVLVEKDHPWASRKPSKRALHLAFFAGLLTVSERNGMLKTYELMDRHFGWSEAPRPATERQINDYLIDKALRSQGIVSLDSICYLVANRRPAIRVLLDARVRRGDLVPVAIEGAARVDHWADPAVLDRPAAVPEDLVHILSPFDPLIIQRKRLNALFGHEHRFEAYVPREKRVFGYFALPVLAGDEIVAVIDLKADRPARHLRVQQWTWVGVGAEASHKAMVEEALHRFAAFQFGG